jgi:hypothetical protein
MLLSPLKHLSDAGQSVWVDYMSRQALRDGTIGRLLREDGVVGLRRRLRRATPRPVGARERRQGGVPGAGLAGRARGVRSAAGKWERTYHLDWQVPLEVDPSSATVSAPSTMSTSIRATGAI